MKPVSSPRVPIPLRGGPTHYAIDPAGELRKFWADIMCALSKREGMHPDTAVNHADKAAERYADRFLDRQEIPE